MSTRMFEDEIELNGFVHNVRWQGLFKPAQNGGRSKPSWRAHWEIGRYGNVDVEIFGRWFDIDFLGDEIVHQIHAKIDEYMKEF